MRFPNHSVSSQPRSIYVSSQGADHNLGTPESPFATLERARDVARTWKQAGLTAVGLTIWLAGGVYRLKQGFRLERIDSGTAIAPIVYRSYPGEQVVLAGYSRLRWNAFKPVTNKSILARIISKEARSKILSIDLKAEGIENYGELQRHGYAFAVPQPPLELYVNGRRMTRARWPNEGSLRMGKIVHDGLSKSRFNCFRRREVFHYDFDRPVYWRKARNIWVDGIFSKNWVWSYNKIAKINPKIKTIALEYPEQYGLLDVGNNFFFAENLLEEIDRSNEYYLDSASGILYFLPSEHIINDDPTITVSTLTEPMIDLSEVSFVTFKNLTLDTGRDVAVSCKGGVDCRFEYCEVQHFGRGGFDMAGIGHVIDSCHIHHVGATAVQLMGGDLKTLESGELRVENCHIHDWGYWQKVYAAAVSLRGVGQQVRHCLIHDGPHVVVEISGNNHLVEYNEIHDVVLQFQDMGCVYVNLGFFPLRRGSVIYRNFFHHIGQQQGDVHGIYVDNGTMGLLIEQNFFYRFGSQQHQNVNAIKANGSSYLVIRNNVFIDCVNTYELSFFLKGWAEKYLADYEKKWRLELQDLQRLPHAQRYPELAAFFHEDRVCPDSNVFERNLICNFELPLAHPGSFKTDLGPATLVQAKDNWVTDQDPGFVDRTKMDFQLRDSVAVACSFSAFAVPPFHKIGLKGPVGPSHRRVVRR